MKISEFMKKGIDITWTLLLICYNSNSLLRNCMHEKRFLSEDEIIRYAIEFIESSADPLIISLAILNQDEKGDAINFLQQLSKKEICNYDFEFRKFRAMYIQENLPNANDEFMHGILRISEIWDGFGFPEDSPNIYYHFKDYSQSNFEKLLDLNNAWLNKEFEMLKK